MKEAMRKDFDRITTYFEECINDHTTSEVTRNDYKNKMAGACHLAVAIDLITIDEFLELNKIIWYGRQEANEC